jgi:peptide/nickel transport system substrate-binding protein
MSEKLTRRTFLKASALTALAGALAACAQPTPTVAPTKPAAAPTATTKPAEPTKPAAAAPTNTSAPAAATVAPTKAPTAAPTAVPKPKYGEAPMLADLVKAGKLPAIDQRLPTDPLVVTGIEVGKYGGTYRQLSLGSGDAMQNWYKFTEFVAKLNMKGDILPNVASGWQFSADGKSITVNLRKGMKWSDGSPFTANDVLFWWEDVIGNDELSPTKPAKYKRGGQLGKVEKVDDYTYKMSWTLPYGGFAEYLGTGDEHWACKNYLKQFHPKYADKAALDAELKKEGVDKWTALWGTKTALYNDPGNPRLYAWTVQNKHDQPVQVLNRNPYYWKVDPAGNQLPYFDDVKRTLVPDGQALLLKAVAGETDFQARRVSGLGNRPVVVENQQKGNYKIIDYLNVASNMGTIFFNFSHKDPVLKELFMKKDFRVALSIAIDREAINQLVYKGLAKPCNVTAAPGTPWFKDSDLDVYSKYDVATANKMLDALGLDKKDSAGFRLRSDGKRLSMVDLTFIPWPDDNVAIQELVKGYWKAVGVEIVIKPADQALWVAATHGYEHDIASYSENWGFFGQPPMWRGTFCTNYLHYAPAWQLYYESGGKSGEEPPAECKKLQSLMELAMAEADSAKRNAIQRQAIEIHNENLWMIGICAEPAAGRFAIGRNNVGNLPPSPYDPITVTFPAMYFKS